jgi:hypothetical protein
MADDLDAVVRQAQDRARFVPLVSALGVLVPLLVGVGIVAYLAWQVAAKRQELAATERVLLGKQQAVKSADSQIASRVLQLADIRTQIAQQVASHPQCVQMNDALTQAIKVADWNLAPPERAWCYQERDLGLQSGQYSVHCNWSPELCNKTKGTRDPGVSPPNKLQTACALSTEIPSTGWKPIPFGYQGSWYQLNVQSPFPSRFPQF